MMKRKGDAPRASSCESRSGLLSFLQEKISAKDVFFRPAVLRLPVRTARRRRTAGNRTSIRYGEGKVVWNPGLKGHLLSSQRMREGEPEGVKGLSAYKAVVRMVEKISVERVADVLHMHPDLVGSSRLKGEKDQGTVLFRTVVQPLIVGTGVFPPFLVHTPLDGRAVRPGNRSADRAGLLCFSGHSGQILAADLLFCHHF